MKRPGAPRLKVGTKIGRDLTVLGVVDDRGRRPVYIVWHREFWCPMACKVFRRPQDAKHEAGVLASLAHPYIVRSFGVYASRYLLLEFLEGPTLSRFLRTQPKGRLDLSDALRVAIYLGAALEHVHKQGFFHLDIKPSNVVVVHGRPILFDFGLARRHAAKRPNWIHGTDPYIAPEECLCQTTTPATDVFGLGVMLYELLTGRWPFPEGSKKTPFPQTEKAPTPLRRHRRAIPAQLDELVLSCLEREPASRPNLGGLLPALHKLIETGPRMWPVGFDP